MGNDISRILIETVIRKALRDVKDSPERSTRNLVDMALHFSSGPFQRKFFETVQEMLQDEHSAYYSLIRDAASSADTDKLVSFGLNLGYNSFVDGARAIRAAEAADDFNIPWMVRLDIHGPSYARQAEAYRSVIRQGEQLGIFTWSLFPSGQPQSLFSLIGEHPDCAFLLFCEPEALTDALLDEAARLKNLLFMVRYSSSASDICGLHRRKGFLYSVYVPYGADDLERISSGELFCCTENLHAVFTLLLADPACPDDIRQEVYGQAVRIRKAQQYRTIPLEWTFDSRFVDGIISEDACLAAFDERGDLVSPHGQALLKSGNLFQHPLREILKSAFPKTPADAGPAGPSL